MNKELIRDLAITGGIYDCICDPYDKLKNGDHHSSVMIDLERFAEKIVRECIDVVAKATASPNGYQALMKHFGVEEQEKVAPKPRCSVCGTTENVKYMGGYQPYLCESVDCIPF